MSYEDLYMPIKIFKKCTVCDKIINMMCRDTDPECCIVCEKIVNNGKLKSEL